MGFVNKLFNRKLVLSLATFWVSLSTYFLTLFGLLIRPIFKRTECSIGNNSIHSEVKEKNEKDPIFIDEDEVDIKLIAEPEAEPTKQDFEDLSVSDNDLKNKKDLIFIEEEDEKKKIAVPEAEPAKQDLKEFSGSENGSFGQTETTQSFFNFKFPTYEEFMNRGGDVNSFSSVETPTAISNSFVVLADKGFSSSIEEPKVLGFSAKESNLDSNDISSESETVLDGFNQEVSEQNETVALDKIEEQVICDKEVQFTSENDSFNLGSDSDSISPTHLNSVVNRLVDSYADGFLSDRDFETEFELEFEKSSSLSEHHLDNSSSGFDDSEEDSDDMVNIVGNFHSEFLSGRDFEEESGNSGEPNSENSGSEEPNSLETLWEHQELIEQLKMELKKVRATGLPTILEETESPKIMEDLKPWKIDEKFRHEEDPMCELHKFYKTYRERMRKFDILNYQKMYAIGFLQLKDPLQSIPTQKSSAPTFTSLLPQNFSLYKSKKSENDPIMKFVEEMESDLEVVYVGQMCLSWEFLQWEYEKALELWEADPCGIRMYNEVAGEFQQFQVLMQRFIEDEPFQGPRVPNYVKARCTFRNLLQVPVIREDSLKDRKKGRKRERGDYVITSDILVEIIEESIRIFWRFVRADPGFANPIVKGRLRRQVELQDPADSELLIEIRTSLQKKERKLKDLLRGGKCILKRLRSCRDEEDDSDQVLCFFSQVDMKLVLRVLKMSRISMDQLVWCRDKLDKISFVNGKIRVEPTFLLFPC